MQTLNREVIEEMNRWEELGLHIEFDLDGYRGATEDDLSKIYEELDTDE